MLPYAQYLDLIIGFFQGRVIDKLEQDILETAYATGGEVKHEQVRTNLHLDLLIESSSALSCADLHDRWKLCFHCRI